MISSKTPRSMRKFMLDTNTASYIIKGNPAVVRTRLTALPITQICISSITQAELLLGVERKPEAKKLHETVNAFLQNVDILNWDGAAAAAYAKLRAECERNGTPLGALDMLIAAHAVSENCVLVTSDQAFNQVGRHLVLEDWTK